MNKSELSAAVATKTGLTQAQAEAAVNGVIDAVTDTLKSGGDVRLVGDAYRARIVSGPGFPGRPRGGFFVPGFRHRLAVSP